jgi:hypothetical protein
VLLSPAPEWSAAHRTEEAESTMASSWFTYTALPIHSASVEALPLAADVSSPSTSKNCSPPFASVIDVLQSFTEKWLGAAVTELASITKMRDLLLAARIRNVAFSTLNWRSPCGDAAHNASQSIGDPA